MMDSSRRRAAYLQKRVGPMGKAEVVADRRTGDVVRVEVHCLTCWEPDPNSGGKVWRRLRLESAGSGVGKVLDAWGEHLGTAEVEHTAVPATPPSGSPPRRAILDERRRQRAAAQEAFEAYVAGDIDPSELED